MLITLLIGDRSRGPIDQAFDDHAADVLGEVLGVRDRSGLHKIDLAVNVRDHRGMDRSRHLLQLIDVIAHRRLGDEVGHIDDAIRAEVHVSGKRIGMGSVIAPAPRETSHVLALVVGDVAAQALGLSNKRIDPTWSIVRDVLDASFIAIPSASGRSRLWKDSARRREVLAQIQIAFDSPCYESRRRVAQVLGNLLELGSERIRSRSRAFDLVLHRHALAELYLRLSVFGWKPGEHYDPPAWMAKPQERLHDEKDVIDVAEV